MNIEANVMFPFGLDSDIGESFLQWHSPKMWITFDNEFRCHRQIGGLVSFVENWKSGIEKRTLLLYYVVASEEGGAEYLKFWDLRRELYC